MRWRAVLLATLAVATASPASAAPKTSVLVLRGSRTGWVEMTFPNAFDPLLGKPSWKTDFVQPVVETKGTFAGAWFEPVGRRVDGIGFVMLPTFPVTKDRLLSMTWARPRRVMPAGRYRVYLLTDGASEVRIQVDGLARARTVRPRNRPNRVSSWTRNIAAPPTYEAGRETRPIATHSNTMGMLASMIRSSKSGATVDLICVDPCAERNAGGGAGGTAAGNQPWIVWPFGGRWPISGPDDHRGEHEVEYTMSGPATGTIGLYAFALTFE